MSQPFLLLLVDLCPFTRVVNALDRNFAAPHEDKATCSVKVHAIDVSLDGLSVCQVDRRDRRLVPGLLVTGWHRIVLLTLAA